VSKQYGVVDWSSIQKVLYFPSGDLKNPFFSAFRLILFPFFRASIASENGYVFKNRLNT